MCPSSSLFSAQDTQPGVVSISLLEAEKFGAAGHGKGAALEEGLEGVDAVLPSGLQVLKEYSPDLRSPSEAANKGAASLSDIMRC